MKSQPHSVRFRELMRPNMRPFTLGDNQDANLVGMRLYGAGPFHRELKPAMQIAKKSHFVIRAGDVIYNKLFAWKGTFGVVPTELDGMYVSDKFPTYELDRSRVNDRYLVWYFRHPAIWEQARLMSTGSAALSKLTLNPPKFLDLEIPLPPLDEQRRIVASIEALAAKLEDARHLRNQAGVELIALTRSQALACLGSVQITGRLSDVLLSAPRNGWSPTCDNLEGGTPVLTLSSVTGWRFNSSAFKTTSLPTRQDAHYWAHAGDLLMTRSNTPELVGHAAIHNGSPNPSVYPDLIMKLTPNPQKSDVRFIWYWLQSELVRKYIQASAKGTSPTMKKVSQGIVQNIPFPSQLTLNQQQRIVLELDALQAKVDAVKALQTETAAELDTMLPAILDKAFKGEL